MNVKHGFIKTILPIFIFAIIGLVGCDDDDDNGQAEGPFTLTVLHSNDQESDIINAGSGDLENFGGAARFATLVRQLTDEAFTGEGSRDVVLVSSGDNFLAGPEFNASLENGVPFFDTVALDLVGYDAISLGNHDFDFGPDVLADFIRGFESDVTFVSANLDFSGESELQELADEGRIAESVVVEKSGELIGVIGIITPDLPFLTSPGNVVVDPEIVSAVQREVDELEADGVNIIILLSHLQSIENEIDLAPMLRGVDIIITGGGEELLADDADVLIPEDEEEEPFGPYPIEAVDEEGNTVLIATTNGHYRYVGRLVADFDENGNIVGFDEETSGPVRVAGGGEPDAVEPDPEVQEQVTEPVLAAVAALMETVVGESQVDLNGERTAVRTTETNEGNLVADALLFQATESADDFGAPTPDIAIQNGGGIRNNSVIPAGEITEFTTFSILPFANFLAIVENISPSQLKEILENAVSNVEEVDGRFGQISGFSFVWDINGTAQILNDDGTVATPGTRVREIILDNGMEIVLDGEVVSGAPSVNIATIDFLVRGGDQYPFRDADFTVLPGITYQQALQNYIQSPDGLDGVITAEDYPEGGEGRIMMGSGTAAAVRFATFNASLNRSNEGDLVADLSTSDNEQAQTVAEIIQRVDPDVILINEFDFVEGDAAADLFQENYLSVSQNGATPVEYPFHFVAPSNTGIPSDFDFNNDGSIGGPEDALGFGFFPGQFGMVVYSKFPIVGEDVRTFQNFLWRDMPGAMLPDDPGTPESADWYSPDELEIFRLSSKSHWDIPVMVDGEVVHVLTSHPTPPVFDGPEDRNGTRNHDEIRLFADYITPGEGDYIYDDSGATGGLAEGASFVIMGDQNADPFDGDSVDQAIQQLLLNPLVNTSVTPTSEGGPEQSVLQGGANADHQGDPVFDTADFADSAPGNLRVDYVLPSGNLEIVDAQVFWPLSDDPLFPLVGLFPFPSSDHRLVWVDVNVSE